MAPKAKIQVWIEKTSQFDQLVSSFGYQVRPNYGTSGGVSVNANNNSASPTGSPNINASPNSNASAVSVASPVAEAQTQGGDNELSGGNKGRSLYHHHHQREHDPNQCESNEGSTTVVGSTAVTADSSVQADKSQGGDGGASMGQNGHEGGQACSSSGTSTGSKV